MSRELNDWLDSYLLYTKNSEPPESYHLWCGLSVIAGALQRRVHLRWGFEEIFPNLYIVLIGPSGSRKGIAMNIARDFLIRTPNISVAPEAGSLQALILAMKRAFSNFEDPITGVIHFQSPLTAFAEELAVLLGTGDIKLLSYLTDWYNSKEDWSYETVGRGRDYIQGTCFTLIGATAPEWLPSMLPQEAVGGGFTARIIFVVEDRKGKTVSKHQLTPAELELQDKLLHDLEHISQLRGQFNFTPNGEQAYTKWYEVEDKLLLAGELAVPDPRFLAYCERRATHIRKLMIICSASRGGSMELDLPDFHRALSFLKSAERNMSRAFGGLGKSRHSDVTDKVLNYIRMVKITTRSTLMAKFYRDVDSQTLREIEEVMDQLKVVSIEWKPDMKEKIYRWIDKGLLP